MPQLYINQNEVQAGIRDGWVDQVGLSGISIGTNDHIIEMLIKEYVQDVAESIKKTAATPSFYWSDALFVVRNYLYTDAWLGPGSAVMGMNGITHQVFTIGDIYKSTLHLFLVFRELTATFCTNGHSMRTVAKVAHNRVYDRLQMFNPAQPSVACMVRLYIGDLSGFSDADLLGIHRANLRHPMITPPELLPYEAFRFTGRQPGGDQILAGDTNIYNEAPGSAGYGETLAIQGGLNWGQIRSPLWIPR